ncbi:helix-turn-helix domain-containing protein [Bacillus sp. PK3_68]|uniref:helix-turn-helix domain-containing protein n=1 Tax=Bacillus sp. PK3_68 TaxID=2027408 RepID=UPI000E71FA9E|nr:helix-turn-helix domain-containing protein [Bacillus sp. PK3_68]RJS58995.1 DNA-binding protein [Bacillus sp. PK3_68]
MEYHLKNREEVERFVIEQVLTTSKAIEILSVTRQKMKSLISTKKITPVKKLNRETLFLRSDIEARKAEQDELRKKYHPFDS